ncbi:unnamed protein product [Moneuplotes crassus]|uniref:Uncharacterized protein n=1 Tax=Euplotes crassus TaxID=5936 RepID=A0AAD1XS83_EUPCR|nr:unnamed protein product [Moneuplotes crassus]
MSSDYKAWKSSVHNYNKCKIPPNSPSTYSRFSSIFTPDDNLCNHGSPNPKIRECAHMPEGDEVTIWSGTLPSESSISAQEQLSSKPTLQQLNTQSRDSSFSHQDMGFRVAQSPVCKRYHTRTMSDNTDRLDKAKSFFSAQFRDDPIVSHYKQKLSHMQSRNTDLKDYIVRLEKKLDAKDSKIADLQTKIVKANAQNKQLASNYSKVILENQRLRNSVKSVIAALDESVESPMSCLSKELPRMHRSEPRNDQKHQPQLHKLQSLMGENCRSNKATF